jgi:hypothetical protein
MASYYEDERNRDRRSNAREDDYDRSRGQRYGGAYERDRVGRLAVKTRAAMGPAGPTIMNVDTVRDITPETSRAAVLPAGATLDDLIPLHMNAIGEIHLSPSVGTAGHTALPDQDRSMLLILTGATKEPTGRHTTVVILSGNGTPLIGVRAWLAIVAGSIARAMKSHPGLAMTMLNAAAAGTRSATATTAGGARKAIAVQTNVSRKTLMIG